MTRFNQFYDTKQVYKYLFCLLALIVSMVLTRGFASLILLVLLMFYAMTNKTEKMCYVILLSSALMMISPQLAPKTMINVAALKAQMLIASGLLIVQMFGYRHSRILTPMLMILPYILFMIIPSATGWCPKVSYLKLFLFTMVFLAYYGCSVKAMLGKDRSKTYRSMMLAVAIFFILGSVLVFPIPSISMMDYEEAIRSNAASFYQGVTNHSQTLGVLMAVLGVLVYADMVFNLQKANRLYIALILCSVFLIYKSASRTSMASFISGVCFCSLIAMRARGIGRSWRGKVVTTLFCLVTVSALSVLIVPMLREKILDFAMKYGKSADVGTVMAEDVFSSRQGKWDDALRNWRTKPVAGNGFQVAEYMVSKRIDSWKDMLTAPVEKSTWTTAILEEGGLIGMFLFSCFLLNALVKWMCQKAYLGLSVFFVFLMCNFGEFSLFSMSMDGGLFWLLSFWGLILDYWRVNGAKRTPYPIQDRHSLQAQYPMQPRYRV